MDPNANLKEQLEIVRYFFDCEDNQRSGGTVQDEHEKTMRLCELVQAMHDWIKDGSFLPDDWKPAEQFVLSIGNAFDGLTLYGPYPTHDSIPFVDDTDYNIITIHRDY